MCARIKFQPVAGLEHPTSELALDSPTGLEGRFLPIRVKGLIPVPHFYLILDTKIRSIASAFQSAKMLIFLSLRGEISIGGRQICNFMQYVMLK